MDFLFFPVSQSFDLNVFVFIAYHLFCICSGSSATATLFEGHPLSLEYLVRNLLKLYVDIEFTGSHTQVDAA